MAESKTVRTLREKLAETQEQLKKCQTVSKGRMTKLRNARAEIKRLKQER